MPKTTRETSVAEVKFVDEPSAKRAKDEIDTPAKDEVEKHPLKMIQRGTSRDFRRVMPIRDEMQRLSTWQLFPDLLHPHFIPRQLRAGSVRVQGRLRP